MYVCMGSTEGPMGMHALDTLYVAMEALHGGPIGSTGGPVHN